jgi:hypothetical protein
VESPEHYLKDMGTRNEFTHHSHRKDIVEAFRSFWATAPSEEKFTEVMGRVTLFPEIVYIMVM